MHINDPTMNYFIINTEHKGNFSRLLKLVNFEQISIPENEVPFALEVLDILSNESIEIIDSNQEPEITIDNIFNNIEKKFILNVFQQKLTSFPIISANFFKIKKMNLKKLISIILSKFYQMKIFN